MLFCDYHLIYFYCDTLLLYILFLIDLHIFFHAITILFIYEETWKELTDHRRYSYTALAAMLVWVKVGCLPSEPLLYFLDNEKPQNIFMSSFPSALTGTFLSYRPMPYVPYLKRVQ